VKHIFWIISGVLLLAVIVAWFLIVPIDEARSSKQKLDQQSKDLKELEKRADKGDPPGVFDAANPDDTKRLANEFLITEQWKRVLQEKHEKYQKQLVDIKAQLLGRAAWLHRSVAPTKNTLEWYNEYIKASEALLASVREAGCLRRATTEEAVSAGGESPATVRQVLGLYTKSGSFPDPKEHPILTTRLRAVELVAQRLIAARIAIADNPLIGPTGRSDERARSGAVISSLEWVGGGNEADGGMRQLPTALTAQTQVRSIGMRLTLDGPISSLLSTCATLERNAETDHPVVAITNASLAKRESTAAGDRFDVVDDSVRMIVSLEIMEFGEPGTGGATDPNAGMNDAAGQPTGAYIYGAQ
jgi:hypothetical protein